MARKHHAKGIPISKDELREQVCKMFRNRGANRPEGYGERPYGSCLLPERKGEGAEGKELIYRQVAGSRDEKKPRLATHKSSESLADRSDAPKIRNFIGSRMEV